MYSHMRIPVSLIFVFIWAQESHLYQTSSWLCRCLFKSPLFLKQWSQPLCWHMKLGSLIIADLSNWVNPTNGFDICIKDSAGIIRTKFCHKWAQMDQGLHKQNCLKKQSFWVGTTSQWARIFEFTIIILQSLSSWLLYPKMYGLCHAFRHKLCLHGFQTVNLK